MANGDDDIPPRRVYIYGRSPPPLDPSAAAPPPMPKATEPDVNPWEPGTFNYLYAQRGLEGGLSEDEKTKQAAELKYASGGNLEPRPDKLERIRDERGMTLPQLDLLAKYEKSQNIWDPAFNAVEQQQPLSPLARSLVGSALDKPPEGQGKEVDYATRLPPSEEREYQAWAKRIGKKPKDEEQDYDLKGYWKDVIKGNPDLPESLKDRTMYERDLARTAGPGRHLPDTYKKPNHPTFSDQSIYHGHYMGGLEPSTGGHWDEQARTFTPGLTNALHWDRRSLQNYFNKYEPRYKVNFPDWYK